MQEDCDTANIRTHTHTHATAYNSTQVMLVDGMILLCAQRVDMLVVCVSCEEGISCDDNICEE